MMNGSKSSRISIAKNRVLPHMEENSVGAEIGVWEGWASEVWQSKTSHLHLVDPWSIEPYSVENEHGSFEDYLNNYSKLIGDTNPENFQKYYDKVYEKVVNKFKDKSVTIHRMFSDEWFKLKIEVDWIYIDGNHEYSAVKTDLINSLYILENKGTIFADDYERKRKPGVTKAINEFVKENKLNLEVLGDTQILIKK